LLGFKRDRKIRDLIERHREILEKRGRKRPHHGAVLDRRRPAADVYFLNRKRALFIIAQSGADNASELVWLMIEFFDAWLAGKLKPADAGTEIKLADAAADAVTTAPELMQEVTELRAGLKKVRQDIARKKRRDGAQVLDPEKPGRGLN